MITFQGSPWKLVVVLKLSEHSSRLLSTCSNMHLFPKSSFWPSVVIWKVAAILKRPEHLNCAYNINCRFYMLKIYIFLIKLIFLAICCRAWSEKIISGYPMATILENICWCYDNFTFIQSSYVLTVLRRHCSNRLVPHRQPISNHHADSTGASIRSGDYA